MAFRVSKTGGNRSRWRLLPIDKRWTSFGTPVFTVTPHRLEQLTDFIKPSPDPV